MAVPDLSESLRTASPQIKRQVFEAFSLQISVDRTEGRGEISATVSEEVARALNTRDPLAREGLAVVPRDIAGARSGPASSRIPECHEPIHRVLHVPVEPAGSFER